MRISDWSSDVCSSDLIAVAGLEDRQPVPADGQTLGELVMRGNTLMKGYLKNEAATREAFSGGWFRTGDLAVMHPDGYAEIKARAKDNIISGGENIPRQEMEKVRRSEERRGGKECVRTFKYRW